ncbi:MAG: DNA-3-methyladenine glycosylase 2 family protein [Ruminococcus sp.]|nr:DNA-3-methyladenine glycosylase 2 family protein [Candidatus Copronaster equi]
MNIIKTEKELIFDKVDTLNISITLDCGQAFRWEQKDENSWHGVVESRAVDIAQEDDKIIISGDVRENDEYLWIEYFDLDRNYAEICEELKSDCWLEKAINQFSGIRILRQNPWEALCSFIISQNNNIPRIKGIIERLCVNFGDDLGNGDFSFPSADVIAKCTVDDLAPLRSGFRAKYIIDAAQKVASSEVNLSELAVCDMETARAELIKIKGVGAKVAECTLLYGCGRVEAFPIDVWVRRIMSELYPDGLPECTKNVEGIAQQYLFHWRRNIQSID